LLLPLPSLLLVSAVALSLLFSCHPSPQAEDLLLSLSLSLLLPLTAFALGYTFSAADSQRGNAVF
jgi:hypothetical protein